MIENLRKDPNYYADKQAARMAGAQPTSPRKQQTQLPEFHPTMTKEQIASIIKPPPTKTAEELEAAGVPTGMDPEVFALMVARVRNPDLPEAPPLTPE